MPFHRHATARHDTWRRVAFVLIFVAATACARADEPEQGAKSQAPASGSVEVTLTDGSTLKVALREERIEFQTRYGKLLVPASDLKRIEFRSRLSAEVARKAEMAVKNLGSKDFHVRDGASAELTRLGEQAYAVLLRVAGEPDAEAARRAREILDKLRESLPADRLKVREDDTIWAGGSQIVGRIAAESLRIETLPFGEQSIRLADVRTLRSPGAVDEGLAEAAPDPGTLVAFSDQAGKTLTFKVTGRARAAGGRAALAPAAFPGGPAGFGILMAAEMVWGTDIYSVDSALAVAAVHAGVLRAGQTGVVKVKILGPQGGFEGSTRNGVTSMAFGPFPGYSVSR